ncbi:N-acetylmuramoyl-L-alanine amidase [Priestia megaterium]|uniref:N-acetylmuramoyl-L-alanine amidase n=1 Tax=Priestia megaterium TaxID=1404 RepID=UPI0035DD9777
MKKITQSLMAMSLVIPSAALIQSTTQVEAQTQKEVTSPSLNVRTGPGTNYKIVDWLQKGEVVNVLKDGNKWDYIEFGNGKKGYISDYYLKTVTVSDELRSVTPYWLTLRNGAGDKYQPIDYLKKGTTVKVISYTGNWAKVSVNGKTGYVYSSYLSKASSTPLKTSSVEETQTVTAYWLTLRNGPGANHKEVDFLKKGTNVIVHSYNGKWAYVTTSEGKKGYVYSSYLSKSTASTSTSTSISTVSSPVTKPVEKTSTTSSVATATKYVNAADGLNLRTGRGVQNKIVVKIPYSASVKVSDVVNGWAKVQYGNYSGYANVSYLVNAQPSVAKPTQSNGELKGKLIVLDPGHGGQFAGAQGFVAEEDVNLQIALKTRNYLQAKGAQVVMTRTSDTACSNAGYNADLSCRPHLATKMKADAFISIHANSGSASASGAESFWYNSSRGDKKLATLILDEIIKNTGMKKRPVDYANFAVLRGSTVPATLIETGFVTNKSDAAKIGSPSYQDKFANAIAQGIQEFF